MQNVEIGELGVTDNITIDRMHTTSDLTSLSI